MLLITELWLSGAASTAVPTLTLHYSRYYENCGLSCLQGMIVWAAGSMVLVLSLPSLPVTAHPYPTASVHLIGLRRASRVGKVPAIPSEGNPVTIQTVLLLTFKAL